MGGVKVAGSAQRRCRGAVLQHGSLLLARSPAAPELDGLKELTGKALDAEEFIQAWLEELGSVLGVAWRREALAEGHRRRAAALLAEKYSAAAWTENRGRGSGILLTIGSRPASIEDVGVASSSAIATISWGGCC